MQDFLIALLIGLILGWLVEWFIDWQYWRPTVVALRAENERLRQQLAEVEQPTAGASSPETPVQAESATRGS